MSVVAVSAVMLGLGAPAGASHAPAPADCVYGSIGERYRALGAEHGVLGPVVRCESHTRPRAGRYNDFAGGGIYWSPVTGAWEVHGAILGLWNRAGRENGWLGFPLSGENPIRGGVFQRFEGAHVYWSPDTGPHAVYGAIFDAYGHQGWETGPLGYPTSSEFAIPGGRRTNFQGGFIEWSPTTGPLVNRAIASQVVGSIGLAWQALGGPNSYLGLPISNEGPVFGGGRRTQFEGGVIYWHPDQVGEAYLYGTWDSPWPPPRGSAWDMTLGWFCEGIADERDARECEVAWHDIFDAR